MNKNRQGNETHSTDVLSGTSENRSIVPSLTTDTTVISNGKWNKKARIIFDNLGVQDYTTEQEERLGCVLKSLSSGMHIDRASKDLLELGNNAVVLELFHGTVDCLFKFHSDSEITVDLLSYLSDRAKKGRKFLENALKEMSTKENDIESLRLVINGE